MTFGDIAERLGCVVGEGTSEIQRLVITSADVEPPSSLGP